MTPSEERLFTRIGWRLLPILTLGYVFNYLDRNNIGFAALTMNKELGLTATQFGNGAGMLFLSYCVLEIPSNMLLYRVGARVWLARIMVTWGVISAATIFVTGPRSFYLLRFLLGAAEAGFFPGVAFYLGRWFPAQFRTRVIAWFMVAIPISSAIGGAISGALLQLDGIAGLSGWKWLFLLEGVPVAVLGVVLFAVLPETPADARWLSDEERQIVLARVAGERRHGEVRQLWRALRDRRVLMLGVIQFGFLVGSYGVGIWLPQIIKVGRLSSLQIGFVTSGVYALSSAGMIAWASHVDRRGGTIRSLAASCAIGGIGLALAVETKSFWMSLAWITVSLVGINGARGIFFTIPMRFLTGVGLAGGLAFINSIGTAGGFIGPFVMGWLTDRTGSFSAGLATMSGFLFLATVMSWMLNAIVPRD